jgi:hypothetical protein
LLCVDAHAGTRIASDTICNVRLFGRSYIVPERDENTEAVRNVEKATDSEPVKGEDLVEKV